METGGSSHSPAGSRKRKGRSRAEGALKQSSVTATSPKEEKKHISGLDYVSKHLSSQMPAFRSPVVPLDDNQTSNEGHPFCVQAGVSFGANDRVKQGLNIFRFEVGNPIRFEPGADAATEIALERIDWSAYKIDQVQDKICVFVCIVGANFPSKGTGNDHIATAVELVIRQCCNELSSNITERMRPKREHTPDMSMEAAADAFYDLMLYAAEVCPHDSEEAKEVFSQVWSGEVTRETMREQFRKRMEELSMEFTEDDGSCPSDCDCDCCC